MAIEPNLIRQQLCEHTYAIRSLHRRHLRPSAGLSLLMGFNWGRRTADALAEVWRRTGRYEGARGLIEAAITEDQIVGSDAGLSGVNVMTMHKSKGKEFDGVVIRHLGNSMSPPSRANEPAPHAKGRRLLRATVTRARRGVLMLTDASGPSDCAAYSYNHPLSRELHSPRISTNAPCFGQMCRSGGQPWPSRWGGVPLNRDARCPACLLHEAGPGGHNPHMKMPCCPGGQHGRISSSFTRALSCPFEPDRWL